jgi:hypothetical protein
VPLRERSFRMPPLQLIVLGVVAMIGLATLRLLRVHLGRTPLPEGRGRRIFLLAFVVVPPIALGALTQPAAGPLSGLSSLPVYVVIVAALVVLMVIAALIAGRVSDGRAGRLVRLALTGSQDDPRDGRSDPPITARLAESVTVVDRANSVFPRGPEFAPQIERADFRDDWDALDGATRTLEDQVAEDYRLDKGVASKAAATAKDARSRLDTLRRLAGEHGQVWAAS